jgi:hypothetical protein
MKITGVIGMGKSERKRDPIPEHFKSLDDAAAFWDSHDLADYWEQTSEASFEVDLRRRVFLTALEPELAKKLARRAHREGVSTESDYGTACLLTQLGAVLFTPLGVRCL